MFDINRPKLYNLSMIVYFKNTTGYEYVVCIGLSFMGYVDDYFPADLNRGQFIKLKNRFEGLVKAEFTRKRLARTFTNTYGGDPSGITMEITKTTVKLKSMQDNDYFLVMVSNGIEL
jgi:uncharacterized protein YktA (UPF0223 family)